MNLDWWIAILVLLLFNYSCDIRISHQVLSETVSDNLNCSSGINLEIPKVPPISYHGSEKLFDVILCVRFVDILDHDCVVARCNTLLVNDFSKIFLVLVELH